MNGQYIYRFVENYLAPRCTGALVTKTEEFYVSPIHGPVVTVFIPTGDRYAMNRPFARRLASAQSDLTYLYRLDPPGAPPGVRVRLLYERLPGWEALMRASNKKAWLRTPRIPVGGSIPGNCCPVCFSLRLAKAADVNGTAGTRCVSCGWTGKGTYRKSLGPLHKVSYQCDPGK